MPITALAAGYIKINISDGGVPKRAKFQTDLNYLGLKGDRQEHTHVHGGSDRAVCLFSLERILALQSEGHPIYPGATGENLTLAGIDWDLVEPGVHLRINQDVLIEVTSFTSPCNALVEFLLRGDISRISQKDNPGWSRVYARVNQTGLVRTGDTVKLEV